MSAGHLHRLHAARLQGAAARAGVLTFFGLISQLQAVFVLQQIKSSPSLPSRYSDFCTQKNTVLLVLM
jgi:hypothetical protein